MCYIICVLLYYIPIYIYLYTYECVSVYFSSSTRDSHGRSPLSAGRTDRVLYLIFFLFHFSILIIIIILPLTVFFTYYSLIPIAADDPGSDDVVIIRSGIIHILYRPADAAAMLKHFTHTHTQTHSIRLR